MASLFPKPGRTDQLTPPSMDFMSTWTLVLMERTAVAAKMV